MGSRDEPRVEDQMTAVRRKVAPPGSMEGEGWIAEDFDGPIDELFDCLKDHVE